MTLPRLARRTISRGKGQLCLSVGVMLLAALDAALAAAPTDQGEAAYRAAVAAALPEGMTLDAEAGVVRWVESAEDGRSLVCAAALAPAGEFPRLDWLEHRLVTELNASPEE